LVFQVVIAVFIARLIHFYPLLISPGFYTDGFSINCLLRCKNSNPLMITPAKQAR